MTDPIIGRKGKVMLGANTIANLANFRLNKTVDDLDGSVFGTSWGATFPGQQKWSGTVAGFLDMSDTNGQVALKIASNAGTKITNIKFYASAGGSYWGPDMTNDSGAGCYVGGFSVNAASNGLVSVDFKIGGVGPIDLF